MIKPWNVQLNLLIQNAKRAWGELLFGWTWLIWSIYQSIAAAQMTRRMNKSNDADESDFDRTQHCTRRA
jgi:hypothetical protein